ncbi:hypothetical protein Tco_0743860 [Tanacetum coccineum]
MQDVSKTDFENYVKANDVVLRNMQNQGQVYKTRLTNLRKSFLNIISSNTTSSSSSGTLPSQTVTNPREHVNAITTRSGKTCEGPSTPLVPTSVVLTPLKEPERNPETSMDKVQKPNPRVPIIFGRPFILTAKALIDLYEEKLTLRVGNDELVFYAEKSKKSKNKQFAHAISVIDFSKDKPFSGSTTNHSDNLPPSSSPVKTSDNLEEFADELTLLKKVIHEENFQVYSNPLFEFDDNFTSSNVNPLFNEKDKDDENENSNVSNFDKPVLLNTPLSDKVECSDPEVDIDEIDVFLAMEVSSNFEEGYYDSEGDISTSQSPENVHANSCLIIESHIPVEDSELVQEEIDIFLASGEFNYHQDEPKFSEDSRVRCFVPVHSSFLAFACH